MVALRVRSELLPEKTRKRISNPSKPEGSVRTKLGNEPRNGVTRCGLAISLVTSLDFLQCIRSTLQQDPTAEYVLVEVKGKSQRARDGYETPRSGPLVLIRYPQQALRG